MRQSTVAAVFDLFLCIGAVSAALITQRVQGAVAKQAVEFILILHLVTGKVLTVPILKKTIGILHADHLIHSCFQAFLLKPEHVISAVWR